MPRKIQSSGISTQGRGTSARRATGGSKGQRRTARRSATTVQNGGKWAGSGRKTDERSEGPEIARQRLTGRGAKARTASRAANANHPSHG
jgi:hypothetical protein